MAEDDPIEGSPAPPQQQQPDAAAQGMSSPPLQGKSSPPSQGRARQRKQLKPLYAGKELDEGACASETILLTRPCCWQEATCDRYHFLEPMHIAAWQCCRSTKINLSLHSPT